MASLWQGCTFLYSAGVFPGHPCWAGLFQDGGMEVCRTDFALTELTVFTWWCKNITSEQGHEQCQRETVNKKRKIGATNSE